MEKQTGLAWKTHNRVNNAANDIIQSNFKELNKIIEISEDNQNTIINHTDS
jgi:hypothetical protein